MKAPKQNRHKGNNTPHGLFIQRKGPRGGIQEEMPFISRKRAGTVQPKLTIGQPDDQYEREADPVAETVMRMPESAMSEDEETQVQAKPIASKITSLVGRMPEKEAVEEEPIVQKMSEFDSEQEEEIAQAKLKTICSPDVHRQKEEDEEALQTKLLVQRQAKKEEDEILQGKFAANETPTHFQGSVHKTENRNDIPYPLKAGLEHLSRMDLSGVRVHYNSPKPAQLKAVAYTQGQDIHVGPGQEKHLPHEGWHAVQQMQGRVKPTIQDKGISINDDAGLEREADVMGAKALHRMHFNQDKGNEKVSDTFSATLPALKKSPVKGTKEDSITPAIPHTFGPSSTEKATATATEDRREVIEESEKIETMIAKGGTEKPAKSEKPSPENDARFQGVIKRLDKTARKEKTHEPARMKVAKASAFKAKTADATAKPPSKEPSSRAWQKRVGKMSDAKIGSSKEIFAEAVAPKSDFLTLLQKLLDSKEIAPQNMEQTLNFKKDGKAAKLKGAILGAVNQRREKIVGNLRDLTDLNTNPLTLERVQAQPDLPQISGDPRLANLHSKDVLPTPKTDLAISMEQNKKQAEQFLADRNIDEVVLREANEPLCTQTIEAKQKLEEHADKVPKIYRGEEDAALAEAQTEVEKEEKTTKSQMRSKRVKAKGNVIANQKNAKGKIEIDWGRVAGKIVTMGKATKAKVNYILPSPDKEVNTQFDAEETKARSEFETNVKRNMAVYKFKRYRGSLGDLKWAIDKLFGMPDDVKAIYEEGKNVYIKFLRDGLVKIANTIETKLKKAKTAIDEGAKKIKSLFVGLEGKEGKRKKLAEQARDKVLAEFKDLRRSVEAKKKSLTQNLARRYKQSRAKLDERIEELRKENQGLVNDFIDKAKAVWEILKNFKNRITELLGQAAGVIWKIVRHPVRFLGNLLKAVKQGFNQFRSNIADHLKQGLWNWLFGNVKIEVPSEFSPRAIFGLVLQVLGITKENLRERVVKLIGPRNAELIQETWNKVSTFIHEGPVGLWNQAKEYADDLKETVRERIKKQILTEIIVAGVKWVVSLFNPVSALIKAIKGIYNVVTFIIRRRKQIVDLVMTIIRSVSNIVKGEIDIAAGWIEGAMARTIPLIIGFLASLLDITGIPKTIRSIINGLRGKVNMAIDKALKKVIVGVTGLAGKGKAAVKKGKEKLLQWWKIRKHFKAQNGKNHTLYFTRKSALMRLVIASKPEDLHDMMKRRRAELNDGPVENRKKIIALNQAGILTSELDSLIKKHTDEQTPEEKSTINIQSLINQKLNAIRNQLIKSGVDELANEDIPLTNVTYELDSGKAGTIAAIPLTKLPGNTKGSHKQSRVRILGWDTIPVNRRGRWWVKAHLLNADLHGPAVPWNLTIGTKETNNNQKTLFEEPAKAEIKLNKVLFWTVTVEYWDASTLEEQHYEFFPKYIRMEWGEAKKEGNKYKAGASGKKHSFFQDKPDFDKSCVISLSESHPKRLNEKSKSVGFPISKAVFSEIQFVIKELSIRDIDTLILNMDCHYKCNKGKSDGYFIKRYGERLTNLIKSNHMVMIYDPIG